MLKSEDVRNRGFAVTLQKENDDIVLVDVGEVLT